MLIRVSGGVSGIGDYLRDGRKAGREYSRSELDNRVQLSGNLERTESLIDSMDSAGERYLHVTLAFKEDHISEETLKELVDDFRKFAMSAYGADEYEFYAEAHLPRIKSYIHQRTGEYIERKPHIHIVIPKVNTLSWTKLDPLFKPVFSNKLGKYIVPNSQFNSLEAWQEYANNKYGLANPKDHRRIDFTSESDMIDRERFSANLFAEKTGARKEKKQQILDQIIERNITNVSDFESMLKEFGSARHVDGKYQQYFNIKFAGAAEGINLKDWVFEREFIELPTAEKIARIETKAEAEYLEAQEARRNPEAVTAELDKWHTLTAPENKYINSGNQKFYQKYCAADDDGKRAMLADQARAFYQKYGQDKETNHEQSVNVQLNPNRSGPGGPAAERTGLQNLSERYLDGPESGSGVLLQADDGNHVHAEAAGSGDDVRRDDDDRAESGELTEEQAALWRRGEALIADPDGALAGLFANESVVSYRDIERFVGKQTADDGQFIDAMAAIMNSPELVMRREGDKEFYTSKEVLGIESALLTATKNLNASQTDGLSQQNKAAIAESRTFNAGQAEAFDLLTSGKRIAATNGAAGTGKSYVLAAIREAYEAEGYTLHGAMLQGKTADDLERDSGIKSRTLHSFLSALDRGKTVLNSKSVVVVDEAGMVGSRLMQRLLAHVEKSGAILRIVGDAKQLHAVDFGNAFEIISSHVELRSLTEIQRQKVEWQRVASEALSRHEIGAALDAYDAHGNLHFAKTQAGAKAALLAEWTADRKANPDQSQVVMVHTNAERVQMNKLMREVLKAEGALKDEQRVYGASKSMLLAPGEKIVFLKNEYGDLNVKNGSAGTVEAIRDNIIDVRLQDNRLVSVNLKTYDDIDHGYAMTVYKTQGITVDKAYLLATPGLTAENTYVAMTRHRLALSVHASHEHFADKGAMTKRFSRAETKEFAAAVRDWSDVAAPARDTEPETDSVVGSLLRDARNEQSQRIAERGIEMQEIKLNLDGERLLARVSHTHGVDPAKYEVVKHDDGSDRIKCGSRHLSVQDFLTKELGLPFTDTAAPLLREVYAEQLQEVPQQARPDVNHLMWKEFRAWFSSDFQNLRCSAWEEQRESAGARFKELAKQFNDKKSRAASKIDPRKPAERSAAVSIVRMQRLQADKALRASIAVERAALKSIYDAPMREIYKDYLAHRATAGDVKALAELRRIQPAAPAPAGGDNVTQGDPAGQQKDVLATQQEITFKVNNRGEVTYARDGKEFMRDAAKSVQVIEQDKESIEDALRFAMDKYGRKLSVDGADDFKRKVVEVAFEKNIKVEFTDQAMNDYREHLTEQQKNAKELQAAAVAAERETQKTAPKPANNVGELVNHGSAPYQHKEGNSPSYFVQIKLDNGREKEIWGVDLERAVSDGGVQIGDRVQIDKIGKRTVSVSENMKSDDGKVIGQRTIETERNSFNVYKVDSNDKKAPDTTKAPEQQAPVRPPKDQDYEPT